MILPRIGFFEHRGQRLGVRMFHMVMVDGDEVKTMCTRQVQKTGKLVDVTDSFHVTCTSCKRRGWIKDPSRGETLSSP